MHIKLAQPIVFYEKPNTCSVNRTVAHSDKLIITCAHFINNIFGSVTFIRSNSFMNKMRTSDGQSALDCFWFFHRVYDLTHLKVRPLECKTVSHHHHHHVSTWQLLGSVQPGICTWTTLSVSHVYCVLWSSTNMQQMTQTYVHFLPPSSKHQVREEQVLLDLDNLYQAAPKLFWRLTKTI